MELRAVDTFLVLAEELHFGRAAARLHVTQGRVSQMIRALEREVGGALFERTSRMVRLTPLGAEFRRGAQAGRDELARTLRDCLAMARGISGQLRVGYNQSVGGGSSPGWCPRSSGGIPSVRSCSPRPPSAGI